MMNSEINLIKKNNEQLSMRNEQLTINNLLLNVYYHCENRFI